MLLKELKDTSVISHGVNLTELSKTSGVDIKTLKAFQTASMYEGTSMEYIRAAAKKIKEESDGKFCSNIEGI